MHISNKCNADSRAEYEMFNKQRVIGEIYCEKPKKVINFILELISEIV